jgi:DNA-binding transcriptional MerR regulator
MIAWIFQIIIGSFLFIFLVHHLIGFLKSTLTIPKIKDLVDSPSEKYKNIYAQLSNKTQMPQQQQQQSEEPTKDDTMKQDLKSFFKKQLSVNKADSATDIYSLDSTYSPYA